LEAEGTEMEKEKVLDLFTLNYATARSNFLDAADNAGAHVESYRHPLSGPTNAPIFIDVATIGPADAGSVVVVGSGTHGVEGFTGSALQAGLLRSDYGSQLPPGTSLVLIHAINPYGFAHLRRVNEDNVDLNRNFRDHSKLYPQNKGYDDLANRIAPRKLSLYSDVKAMASLLWFAAKNGMSATRLAVTGGQYSYPEGLFFGGSSESWSLSTLRKILKRHRANASDLVFIDIHTGLGSYKNAEIIVNVGVGSPTHKRAKSLWGNNVKSTRTDESVSVGMSGPLKLAVPDMLPKTTVTSVSLEFGTLPSLKVLHALRTENWLHHYGGSQHPNAKVIKSNLQLAFNPTEDDWRLAIWEQGKEAVDKALS
jgi:predicted deacylase